MRVLGKIIFSIEADGIEQGGVRKSGDYKVSIDNLTMPLGTDVSLAKNDANISVGLGGLTTIKFLHVKAVFDDDTVPNANIELLVNDGSGDKTLTGTEFLFVDCDFTSIKLTNNTDDSTGSKATVFIDMAGV